MTRPIKYTLLADDGVTRLMCGKAAEVVGNVTANSIRHCITSHGIRTVAEAREYFAIIAKDKMHFAKKRTYLTPYGDLTCLQILERHPYRDDLVMSLISQRLNKRGGMCPSLWWGRMTPSEFRVKLRDEGLNNEHFVQNHKKKSGRWKIFNKRTTCFRNGHKCDNYWSLTESFFGGGKLPKVCKSARGDNCKNYEV